MHNMSKYLSILHHTMTFCMVLYSTVLHVLHNIAEEERRRVSYFCNFRNALIDYKSQVQMVKTFGVDRHTDKQPDIPTY